MRKPVELTYCLLPPDHFRRPGWSRLFLASKSNNLFYHPSFTIAALKVWPEHQPTGVVTGWYNRQLVAFQPYLEKQTTFGKVVTLFSLPTADRNAPILAPGLSAAINSELLEFLIQKLKPDLFVVPSVQGEIYELLCRQYANFYLRTESNQIGYIRYMASSVEGFWNEFNSKSRNQFKRKIRKCAESGLKFRIVNRSQMPEGYSLTLALESLTRLHKMRFKALNKASFFTREDFQALYKNICTDTAGDGLWITFTEAMVQNEVVGSMLGIRSDTHYIYLMIGFDPEYGPLSLGNVLIYHTMEDLIQKGIQTFDFKCGDEPYKRKWTKDFYTKYSLIISFTFRGRLLLYARYALTFAMKLKRFLSKRIINLTA